MSTSTEIKAAYERGVAKGTAQGRLLGRLEAYRDLERYLNQMLPGIPRYESPQYIKQALSHCQSRIAHLSQPPARSIQDNVEDMKRISDDLKEKRNGR